MLKDYVLNKPVIKDELIILRPLVKEDVNDLKEWTAMSEIYQYWGKNPGKYDLNPELYFVKEMKPSKSFHLGIELKEEKKIIGDIYIYLIERNKKAKIAIRINPLYHSRGIATDAIKLMTGWCFLNTELELIWSDVDVNNLASIKMLEKSNFKRTETVIAGKMVSTMCDYYIYELTK